MTREEAIINIKRLWKMSDLTDEYGDMLDSEPFEESVDMAIKALSQEPITTTNNNEPITIIYPTIVCDDAISREDAIISINKLYEECEDWRALNDLQYGKNQGLSLAIAVIEDLPPVTPSRRKGHWRAVYQGDEIINYRCSECELGDTNGSTNLYGWDYCRRCGAEMDGEE